ncbi:ankyrin, partial [Coprinellus micaceus]
HVCAWGGKDEVARILLECGVDPNIQSNDGWSPLHYACIKGHLEVAEYFLDHNAD